MFRLRTVPVLVALQITAGLVPGVAPAQEPTATRICLAPASAELASGDAAEASAAVRETFTGFLTGPSLAVHPLTARLASQAREEAALAGCPFVLLPTLKHSRKSGGGIFGRAVAGAVRDGAWSAAAGAGSTVGRAAASAAAGAASEAAWSFATSIQNKDEVALSYRLEAAGGAVLLEKTEKRRAGSDGEDLLTPLVEKASEAVAAAVVTGGESRGGS